MPIRFYMRVVLVFLIAFAVSSSPAANTNQGPFNRFNLQFGADTNLYSASFLKLDASNVGSWTWTNNALGLMGIQLTLTGGGSGSGIPTNANYSVLTGYPFTQSNDVRSMIGSSNAVINTKIDALSNSVPSTTTFNATNAALLSAIQAKPDASITNGFETSTHATNTYQTITVANSSNATLQTAIDLRLLITATNVFAVTNSTAAGTYSNIVLTVGARGVFGAISTGATPLYDASLFYLASNPTGFISLGSLSATAPLYDTAGVFKLSNSFMAGVTAGDSTHVAVPSHNAQGVMTGLASVAIAFPSQNADTSYLAIATAPLVVTTTSGGTVVSNLFTFNQNIGGSATGFPTGYLKSTNPASPVVASSTIPASDITGLPGGDNLGNHIALSNLNMAAFNVSNATSYLTRPLSSPGTTNIIGNTNATGVGAVLLLQAGNYDSGGSGDSLVIQAGYGGAVGGDLTLSAGNERSGTGANGGTVIISAGNTVADDPPISGSAVNIYGGTGNGGTGAVVLAYASGIRGKVGIGTASPTNLLSVAGIIESYVGGFKFPDGTTQTTAGTAFNQNGVAITNFATPGYLKSTNAANAPIAVTTIPYTDISGTPSGSSLSFTYNTVAMDAWQTNSAQEDFVVVTVNLNGGAAAIPRASIIQVIGTATNTVAGPISAPVGIVTYGIPMSTMIQTGAIWKVTDVSAVGASSTVTNSVIVSGFGGVGPQGATGATGATGAAGSGYTPNWYSFAAPKGYVSSGNVAGFMAGRLTNSAHELPADGAATFGTDTNYDRIIEYRVKIPTTNATSLVATGCFSVEYWTDQATNSFDLTIYGNQFSASPNGYVTNSAVLVYTNATAIRCASTLTPTNFVLNTSDLLNSNLFRGYTAKFTVKVLATNTANQSGLWFIDDSLKVGVQ